MTTCSVMLKRTEKGYDRIVHGLSFLAPVADLAVRLWVARIFWLAGMAKLQSMTATIALFRYMYHVPLLPPVWAAYLGTGIEILFPILLAFGLAGRFAAGFLFIYNMITVISYPQMGFSGMMDQVPWGIFLLVTVVYGPGIFSLDYGLLRIWKHRTPTVQKTV